MVGYDGDSNSVGVINLKKYSIIPIFTQSGMRYTCRGKSFPDCAGMMEYSAVLLWVGRCVGFSTNSFIRVDMLIYTKLADPTGGLWGVRPSRREICAVQRDKLEPREVWHLLAMLQTGCCGRNLGDINQPVLGIHEVPQKTPLSSALSNSSS